MGIKDECSPNARGVNLLQVALHHALIFDLAIVTSFAAAFGLVVRWLGQPSVLGYLLAGLVVGPYLPIPLFADPQRMEELAEVGVVLVMFAVGLEFRVRRLLDILPVSGLAACIQIATLAWAGFALGAWLGWSDSARICLGATLAISSTMVVSAVLRTKPVNSDIRAHIFGILVVQDVVAILLIAIVTALASGKPVSPTSLGLLTGQLIGFVLLVLAVSLLILPRLVRFSLKLSDTEVVIVLVASAAFLLALIASYFGYSVALGAFVAGVAVAESGRGHAIEEAMEPLRALFSAIFFVSIGMAVDPVVAWANLPLALGLTVIVIVGQFASVLVATVLTGSTVRRGVYSGLALGQIGELSFILAKIAVKGGSLPEGTLSALVTVATITAFTTPALLGSAQRIVAVIDRALPDRFNQSLAAYQSLFRRARDRESGDPALARTVVAVLLDWTALVIIFIVRYGALSRLGDAHKLIINVAAIILAVPFMLGLVRSGIRLASRTRALTRGRSTSRAQSKTVEAIALLAIVVAIGIPTTALLIPIVEGPWLQTFLLTALLIALLLLGLNLTNLNREHTSSVARIALGIEGHLREPSAEENDLATQGKALQLAELDYELIHIEEGSPAVGKSLAELDVRVRSGATIIAVRRADGVTNLPTGHDRLHAQDDVAVSGSKEAIERAREILCSRDLNTPSRPSSTGT